MANVLLAEHDYQVRDLLGRESRPTDQWVALGPTAMAQLDQARIPYRVPEDFYRNEDLAERGTRSRDEVERLCEHLDALCLEAHPDLAAWGLRPFLFHIFPLLVVWSSIRGRLFKFASILRAFPGCSLTLHHERDTHWSPPSLFFAPRDTLWGNIASLPGWPTTVNLVPEPARGSLSHVMPGKRLAAYLRKAGIRLTQRSLILTSTAMCYEARDFRGALDVLRLRPRGTLLVLNNRTEWAHTLPLFRRHGFGILLSSDKNFAAVPEPPASLQATRAWDRATASPEFGSRFTGEGVSFYPLIKERLSWIMSHAPCQLRTVRKRIDALRKRWRLQALLTSVLVSGARHAIAGTCRALDLPVFTWQHGFVYANPHINQLNDYNDLLTSSTAFVYGSEVEKAYGRTAGQFSSCVRAVGSASLDALGLRSGSADHRNGTLVAPTRCKRVLYATTNYYLHHWYLGFDPPWSDCLFYRDQAQIVGRLEELAAARNLAVTVKLHPSFECQDPPWVEHFRGDPRFQIIKNERRFTDLLPECDLVLLDFPSTTLLQALATLRPVIALTRHLALSSQTLQLLARRAACAATVQELMRQTEDFLDSGRYEADVHDREYLKAYGTFLDDQGSARRVVDVVVREVDTRGDKAPAGALAW